jgi:hypothetical protein
MYLISVVLLLFVFPAVSVLLEVSWRHDANWIMAACRWFVFWPVGVRLFIAGVRQVLQPEFTAKTIFGMSDPACSPVVREIGFGNLAMGTLGAIAIANAGYLAPAAIVGAIYYGLAGAGHVVRGHLNANGRTALISDILIAAVLAVIAVRNLVF